MRYVAYTLSRKIALAVVSGILVFSGAAASNASEFGGGPAMKALGAARAPIGHVQFCMVQPDECAGSGTKGARIAMDAARFDELDLLNRTVNAQIEPITDDELYGVAELWAYPTSQGDCEDYVLLKRRSLIDAGWDAAALLITVVRDLKGAGHAVLTVVTDRGDFILDNQRDDILPWTMTGYQFVKRQSQTDPKSWVFVGPARTDTGVASTR